MNKISELTKKYKAELTNSKAAEISFRYNQRYNQVVVPHLKSLDESFNETITALKAKFDKEKADYIEKEKQTITAEVDAEFSSVLAAIEPFISDQEV